MRVRGCGCVRGGLIGCLLCDGGGVSFLWDGLVGGAKGGGGGGNVVVRVRHGGSWGKKAREGMLRYKEGFVTRMTVTLPRTCWFGSSRKTE